MRKPATSFDLSSDTSPCTGKRVHEDLPRHSHDDSQSAFNSVANEGDMHNVTANQRSTGQPFPVVQSGVNRTMEEKVIVAVCDSRSSIYNGI